MICDIRENFAYIRLPGILFDYDKLKSIAKSYYCKINKFKNIISIDITDKNVPLIIRKIFSEYHSIDINFLEKDIEFENSENPKLSCIILLNSNYEFVNELTIPSIIFNSKNIDIEIIIVHNGENDKFEFDNDVKFINSEKYHIPKAYNAGVAEATGKYVALFHDDCELRDELWIEKLVDWSLWFNGLRGFVA